MAHIRSNQALNSALTVRDSADLWWPDDPNGAASNEETFASWDVRTEPTISWPLLGEGQGGVAATKPMDSIPQRPKDMALLGGTEDGSAAAYGPTFTAADLKRLRPGQIIVANQSMTADTDQKTGRSPARSLTASTARCSPTSA